MINDAEIKQWIKHHEGYRDKAYKDSVGIITIGWGRNLQTKGITKAEAELLFQNDYNQAVNDIKGFNWYQKAPDGVKKALINMSFNLGLPKLLGFKKMIQALINEDYARAAREALDSKWATDVGRRAKDIAVMIREGK